MTQDFTEDQVRMLSEELNDAHREIERLERERTNLEQLRHGDDEAYRRLGNKANDLVQKLDEALDKLNHPAVAAVVALVEEGERQRRRAECAFDERDKANRRWLDAKHGKDKA